jgi:hypothetical protein
MEYCKAYSSVCTVVIFRQPTALVELFWVWSSSWGRREAQLVE